MKAKEVMSTNPEYFSPDDTLKKAAEIMRDNDFGFLPIGENDRLIGAVTDRDIVIRAVADGKNPNTTLREVMTDKIQYCFESDPIEDVAKKMGDLQLRRMVVLNKDKRIAGIISLGDIATKTHNEQLSGQVTTAVSE